jgi:hypothetical protein
LTSPNPFALSQSQTFSLAKEKEHSDADLLVFVFCRADLERQTLSGKEIVSKEAYNSYHSDFLVQSATLDKQMLALKTISSKIQSFIANCPA